MFDTNAPFFCLELQKYFATLKELSVISGVDSLFIGSHIIAYKTLNANVGRLTLQNCHFDLKNVAVGKSFRVHI